MERIYVLHMAVMKNLSLRTGIWLILCIGLNGHSQRLQQKATDLPASIDACFQTRDTNVAVILPTAEKTRDDCDRIGNNVRALFKTRELFLEDTNALGKDLSQYTIITYGTFSGNLWARQHLADLPVTILPDRIVTDREFKGKNLRLISCWSNPANAAKPWVIYTAQKAEDVVGINRVFHGWAQFHVIANLELLQSGYYSRTNGHWAISDRPAYDFPNLTPRQMYEDYDALTNIVEQVFPLMEVNRQVYGLDVRELLRRNRDGIKTTSTTEQFVNLINRTIVACRGSHFWINSASPEDKQQNSGFVDEEAYSLGAKYLSYLQQTRASPDAQVPLLYFKGDYYTLCDFIYDGVPYPKGMKVLRCNGKTPDTIVSGLVQSGVILQWDYNVNKFFTPEFCKYAHGSNGAGKGKPPLRLELQKTNGKTLVSGA